MQAVRRGYWIVLDELNLAPSDVLEALNRLLDDNRELFVPELQETITPHPHFMLFATQNPPGATYGGRKVLSKAFRNRFMEIHVGDIPDDELRIILNKRCAIAPSYCAKLVEVMRELQRRRQASRAFAGKDGFITARDLFRWANRKSNGYEELAADGFRVLGERLRSEEEREAMKVVLSKVLKTPALEESKMYAAAEEEALKSRLAEAATAAAAAAEKAAKGAVTAAAAAGGASGETRRDGRRGSVRRHGVDPRHATALLARGGVHDAPRTRAARWRDGVRQDVGVPTPRAPPRAKASHSQLPPAHGDGRFPRRISTHAAGSRRGWRRQGGRAVRVGGRSVDSGDARRRRTSRRRAQPRRGQRPRAPQLRPRARSNAHVTREGRIRGGGARGAPRFPPPRHDEPGRRFRQEGALPGAAQPILRNLGRKHGRRRRDGTDLRETHPGTGAQTVRGIPRAVLGILLRSARVEASRDRRCSPEISSRGRSSFAPPPPARDPRRAGARED